MGEKRKKKALVGCMEEEDSLVKERVAVCCFQAYADLPISKMYILSPSLISGCQCDVNWLTQFLAMNSWLVLLSGKCRLLHTAGGLHWWAERHWRGR